MAKQLHLPGLEPTRKPDALPPKTETVIKLNNGGTASKRIEDQPGYDYEKDPNILRRLKYITRTFDDNDIGNSLDAAIDKEDIELKKLGKESKNLLQRERPKPFKNEDPSTYPSNKKQQKLSSTWDALVQSAKDDPNDPNSKDTKKLLMREYNKPSSRKYLSDDELKLIGKHKSQLPKPAVNIPSPVIPDFRAYKPEPDPSAVAAEKRFMELLRKNEEEKRLNRNSGIGGLLGGDIE